MGIFDRKKESGQNLDREVEKIDEVGEQKLVLRKEELDIAKDKVRTGEVILGKDIVEERKTVGVPVMHEEVVIERKALDNEFSDEMIGAEETIRIPVSEEQVQVGKHTVLTGEVTARKREVAETRTVDETLKREEARVDKEGDPTIVEGEHLE